MSVANKRAQELWLLFKDIEVTLSFVNGCTLLDEKEGSKFKINTTNEVKALQELRKSLRSGICPLCSDDKTANIDDFSKLTNEPDKKDKSNLRKIKKETAFRKILAELESFDKSAYKFESDRENDQASVLKAVIAYLWLDRYFQGS